MEKLEWALLSVNLRKYTENGSKQILMLGTILVRLAWV